MKCSRTVSFMGFREIPKLLVEKKGLFREDIVAFGVVGRQEVDFLPEHMSKFPTLTDGMLPEMTAALIMSKSLKLLV